MSEETIICGRCRRPLEPREVTFEYMGHHFTHVLPVCPQCGQIYISEELAGGKIRDVEMMLEQK